MNLKDMNPLLVRRQPLSWFEKDTEVVEYINSLDRYCTIKEMRRLIAERFGPGRTPSKSSLARFLKKITTTCAQDREDFHGK